MRRLLIGIALALSTPARSQTGLKPPPKPSTAKVVALADLYLAAAQKQMSRVDRAALDSIMKRLTAVQQSPEKVKITIESIVNQLTGALATMQSANGLTAASAFLVKLEPDNPRVTNLFGAVLHSTARSRDAAKVLELTLAQSPGSTLARLNLANAYLDVVNDTGARRLANLVVAAEPNNRDAHQVLAVYWLRRQNLSAFQSELLKASTFESYVRRDAEATDKLVDANEVTEGMSDAAMDAHVTALAKSVPSTTADLLDHVAPAIASEIRAKYTVLPAADRVSLPQFPSIKTNSNRDYAENFPIVGAWMKVFAERHMEYQQQRTGINAGTTAAQAEAIARATAGEEMQKAMQSAQDAMKYLKNVPGVSQAQVNDALRQVNAAAAQHKVKLVDKTIDPETPPGYDTGSVFAKTNYRQYLVISRSYETYLRQIFQRYRSFEQANFMVYIQKTGEEAAVNAANLERIEKSPNLPTYERLKLEERIRHIKTLNHIGDTYYKLWVNLYIPFYAQKMKPGLEAYWNVTALYIRNMTDLEVIAREYDRVKAIYMDHAINAATAAGSGMAFAYAGSTEEEEAALAAAIKAAEEEAKVKTIVFLKDHKVHKIPTFAEKPGPDDWIFWTGQKFDYAVNGQFLSLHVTSRNIEFGAWAFGPAAGIKLEFDDGKLTKMDSYWAIEARFKIGVQMGGTDLTAGGAVEFGRQTSSWDFENGTYSDGFPTPSGSLTVKAKAGNFDGGGSVKYDLAKGFTSASVNANAGFGPMTAAGEITYDVGKGVSGSGSVTATGGPISSQLSTEFDAQLHFQRKGEVTAGGKKLLAKDFSIGPPTP